MSNPYLRDDGQAILRKSWFCFLDILGFKEFLIANDQARIVELHELLREGRETLEGGEYAELFGGEKHHALTSFTDNIVLGFPINDDGEIESGMVFERLAQFQLNMVLSGFFVRGGVAVGEAYIDDLAVYGPALLEAYKGESELARDPRIVLTDSAKTLVIEHLGYYGYGKQAPQDSDLKRDRDGQWFVDYLNSAVLDIGTELDIDQEAIAHHRDIVVEKLEQFRNNPRIWSKYEWAALYHNDFCDRFEEHLEPGLMIDVASIRGSISSILDG